MLPFLAFALFLRVMVPGGWMPAADGSFTIVLCPSDGPVAAAPEAEPGRAMHHGDGHHAATADHGGGDADHHDPSQPDPQCSFAPLSAAMAAPAEIAALAPPALPAIVLPTLAPTVAIGRGLAAPPPPSTGPPATL